MADGGDVAKRITVKELIALAGEKPGTNLSEPVAGRGKGVLKFRTIAGREVSIYYRHVDAQGVRRDVAIGRFDTSGAAGMTLDEARKRAGELAQLHAGGVKDIAAYLHDEEMKAAREREARLAEERTQSATLGRLLDTYVAHLEGLGKHLSAKDAGGLFRRHVEKGAPELIGKRAAAIGRDDILQMLRHAREKGLKRSVNKLRSYLMAAFNLPLLAQSDVDLALSVKDDFGLSANPVSATRPIRKFEVARDRVMTDEEIRGLWNALDGAKPFVRDVVCLALILGGQRIGQLLRVSAADVDLVTGTIRLLDPKGRRSQPRVHLLPVPAEAKPIIERLIKQNPKAPSIFSITGESVPHLADVSRAVSDIAAKLHGDRVGERFCLRDVRRTCETRLAALKVSKDVRAQLQSHGLGGVQDRHYDRHGYMDEKAEALRVWNDSLTKLLKRDEDGASPSPNTEAASASAVPTNVVSSNRWREAELQRVRFLTASS